MREYELVFIINKNIEFPIWLRKKLNIVGSKKVTYKSK